jgi:hypothetical protein
MTALRLIVWPARESVGRAVAAAAVADPVPAADRLPAAVVGSSTEGVKGVECPVAAAEADAIRTAAPE